MALNKENTEKVENRNTKIAFRIFQAIFLGIFALGLSLCAGDFSVYVKSPISSFSLTTMIFGLIGAITTGILAKQSERW